jgi:hypothetical protein
MFVLFDPAEQRFPAHKLSATERYGRDWRTAGHATGDSFADMRFRAVQQLGYIGERQKIEII